MTAASRIPSSKSAEHTTNALQASSNGLFEAIFECSADALFISTDEDDAVVFDCNQRAVEMFDAPNKQALIGHPTNTIRRTISHPEDFAEKIQLLHKNDIVRTEIAYITFTGRAFWGEYLVKRIPVGQGFVRLARIIDITERKKLEDEIRHTTTILADAQSTTKLGTWEFDVRTQDILWSDETYRLYGLEPEMGKISYDQFWELIHPDDVPLLQAALQKVQKEGKNYMLEVRGLQPDGSYYFHEARGKAVFDEANVLTKIIGTVRNINEDKRKEAELLYNQERLEDIINNITEVIVQMNFEGIIEFVSKSWETLTGTTFEDAVQRSFVDFIHPDDAIILYQILTESLVKGIHTKSNVEYRAWHQARGEWMWQSANAVVIKNSNGVPQHILATVRDITAQKLVAEKLVRSEEILSEAQKMARLGNWYAYFAHQTIEWSEEMYRIFGLPLDANPLSREQFLDIVYTDDRQHVSAALMKAIRHQEMAAIEMRIIRGDGSLRWLDARVKPVMDRASGRTIALFGTIWDITERKLAADQIRALNLNLEERVRERTEQLEESNAQLLGLVEERMHAEQALQLSQNNLRTLVESTNDAIWSIDRQYRFATVNAAFFSLLRLYNGYEVTIGDSALFDTLGLTSKEWLQYYNRVLQGERFSTNAQYQLTEYDFEIEVSFNPIISEKNDITGAVVFARDISERLAAEREIRDSEGLLNLILETVATGVALTNPEGRILRVNRAFAEMLGYTPQELANQQYTVVVPPERRTLAMNVFGNIIQSRSKVEAREAALFTKKGEYLDVEISQSVIGVQVKEMYVVSSVNNITGRKQTEDEIRSALEQERELRAMQSRFVVMVSHEFRTPLTTIRASAQLLERNREKWSADKQASYFQDIDHSVSMMTELLEDVLSWGKTNAKRKTHAQQATNVLELLDTIVDGFRVVEENSKRISVITAQNLPAQASSIAALDQKLFHQIVGNLLANGLKYSPSDTVVVCEMVLNVDSIRIRVADKGIGISEEDQKHLFEPFYRAANVGAITGTGLGLAIVWQAVEQNGGTIHCTSTLGVGTEFLVVIPCTFS
jgi:PAS domain S-box-containing protein